MTTNESDGRSHAPQETATDRGYVGLQANVSTVGPFANKYIALNHEWNITNNYAARMHKTLSTNLCTMLLYVQIISTSTIRSMSYTPCDEIKLHSFSGL